jgi:hypothetical protein
MFLKHNAGLRERPRKAYISTNNMLYVILLGCCCVPAEVQLQGVSTISSWTGLVDWTQQKWIALDWTHGVHSYTTAARKWLFA